MKHLRSKLFQETKSIFLFFFHQLARLKWHRFLIPSLWTPIPWLLMFWQSKKAGHEHPRYFILLVNFGSKMRLAIFIRCLKNMCIGLNGRWYWLFTEFRVTELFTESIDINATTHRNVCFGLDERANAHQWILFVDFILICYYSPHMPALLVKNTSFAWQTRPTDPYWPATDPPIRTIWGGLRREQ